MYSVKKKLNRNKKDLKRNSILYPIIMKEINPLFLSENYPSFTSQYSVCSTSLSENFQICQELDKYKHLLYMYKNEFKTMSIH